VFKCKPDLATSLLLKVLVKEVLLLYKAEVTFHNIRCMQAAHQLWTYLPQFYQPYLHVPPCKLILQMHIHISLLLALEKDSQILAEFEPFS